MSAAFSSIRLAQLSPKALPMLHLFPPPHPSNPPGAPHCPLAPPDPHCNASLPLRKAKPISARQAERQEKDAGGYMGLLWVLSFLHSTFFGDEVRPLLSFDIYLWGGRGSFCRLEPMQQDGEGGRERRMQNGRGCFSSLAPPTFPLSHPDASRCQPEQHIKKRPTTTLSGDVDVT